VRWRSRGVAAILVGKVPAARIPTTTGKAAAAPTIVAVVGVAAATREKIPMPIVVILLIPVVL
jgi:hypothetical protein